MVTDGSSCEPRLLYEEVWRQKPTDLHSWEGQGPVGRSYLDDSRPVSMAFFQRIAGKTERLPEEGIYAGKVEDPEGRCLSEWVMEQELEAYEGPDPRSPKRK